jgi:hypothetical protein
VLLTPNPSYLTAAQFQAMPLDYDLTSYDAGQIQDLLNRASGTADAFMRRSLLAKERTVRYTGDGSNKLELRESPILYVKRLQLIVPGSYGAIIPPNQLLIDYQSGSVINYTPVYLMQGLGYYSMFPSGCPIDVTLAYGYGYSATTAPSWSAVDSGSGAIPAGTYNVALTTKTMYGETTAAVGTYTTATGSFLVSPGNVLGGYVYRAYLSSAANNTTLAANMAVGANTCSVASAGTLTAGDVLLIGGEYLTVANVAGTTITTTTGATIAHSSGASVIERPMLAMESPFTSYGASGLQFTVSSLTPQNGIWQDAFPLTDTSAPVLPQAITEAVRLLAMSIIYEQNNPANRGFYLVDSGRKRTSYRATDGNSAKGVSSYMQQASELLKPYALQAIF